MKAQLFEITHTTFYRYRQPVFASHNVLRLAPRRFNRQTRLDYHLRIDPLPATQSVRTDYFGNEVVFATFVEPHQELRISSTSRVAVFPPYLPDPAETPAWESVGAYCLSDRSRPALEAAEFMFASPHVPVGPAYADYAQPSFSKRRPLMDAIVDFTDRMHCDFTFDPTATSVSTPLTEVLANRRGVCQDFAHLQIACLRSMGIPARYVSGYLETLPPPGCAKLTGADASHAWLSFFCPGMGWIDVDPTNNLFPSMRHITIGWGRDYGDVAPLRGVVSGGGDYPILEVAVDVLPKGIFDPGGADERGER